MEDSYLFLREYDNVLLGKQTRISNRLQQRCKTTPAPILDIFRYAFSYYMNWSPQMVSKCLTYEILQKLKLDRMMHFLPWPLELDQKVDLYYIAVLCYPDQFKYSPRDAVIHVYQNLQKGVIKKFPKQFFQDDHAEYRAELCLQYALTQKEFTSIRQLYGLFAQPDISEMLKELGLYDVCKRLFTSPVYFLHEALSENQKSNFWYFYYEFVMMYEKAGRKLTPIRRKT